LLVVEACFRSAWLKTLKKRHEELIALSNENSHRERRFYGSAADKELVKEPHR